jgi:hypothetical protein
MKTGRRYSQADTTLASMIIKTNPFTAKDAKDAKESQYLDSCWDSFTRGQGRTCPTITRDPGQPSFQAN